MDEFEDAMRNPQMLSFLKGLDLVPQDARQLFYILDADGSGTIDPQELMGGCLRLHGPAKALELAALIHEFSKRAENWDAQFDQMNQKLLHLCGGEEPKSPLTPATPVKP